MDLALLGLLNERLEIGRDVAPLARSCFFHHVGRIPRWEIVETLYRTVYTTSNIRQKEIVLESEKTRTTTVIQHLIVIVGKRNEAGSVPNARTLVLHKAHHAHSIPALYAYERTAESMYASCNRDKCILLDADDIPRREELIGFADLQTPW